MNRRLWIAGTFFAAAVLAIALYATEPFRPPLPPQLGKLECPAASKRYAPGGYAVFTVQNTTFAAPCREKKAFRKLERTWGKDDPLLGMPGGGFSFIKTPEGGFAVEGQTFLIPAQRAAYAVEASFFHWEHKVWTEDDLRRRYIVKVPTPAKFGPTGAETTFYCESPFHPFWRHSCMAQARSNHLNWHIQIASGSYRYRKPEKDEVDVEAMLHEGYAMLAEHILSQ